MSLIARTCQQVRICSLWYLMIIHSILYVIFPHCYPYFIRNFQQLRVDIADKIVQVYPYSLGTPFNPPSTVSLPYPVKLVPKEKFDFYTARQSFNLYSLLTNPMVLFAIGGLGLLAVSSFVDVKALQEAAKQMDEP